MELRRSTLHLAHVPADPSADAAGGLNPSLRSLSVETTGRRCHVKVQLQAGEGLYEGVASGPDSPPQRLRLVASAAVQAVEELLGGVVPMAVEDVQELRLGGRTVIALSIALPAEEQDSLTSLLGVAVVGSDPLEAVVRAVLNATPGLR